ncbi:MAG: FIST signal transduction protein [Phycisphaerales bacterium]
MQNRLTGTTASLEVQPDGTGIPAGAHPLNSGRTLVLAFAGPDVTSECAAFAKLRGAFPDGIMLGCSTSGHMFGSRLGDSTISVAAKRFEHTDLSLATAPVRGAEDSFIAGRTLGEQLKREGLAGVFVLSDGLKVNGSELVRGMTEVLGPGVVITGGLAGDGARFQKTWLVANGRVQTDCVVAVGFRGGRVRIGHGTRGGWDVFGVQRTVTESRNNVLFKLDGRPALEVYKKYLGERAAELPASALLFPLCISKPESPEHGLVRTILSVNETDQSMTFAGDIPEGARAMFMKANPDRLVNAATEAGTDATGEGSSEPLLVAVSCVGRRLVLGPRAVEEAENLSECLPVGGALAGFYSYGELAPSATGFCSLHNQTMTVTALWEE